MLWNAQYTLQTNRRKTNVNQHGTNEKEACCTARRGSQGRDDLVPTEKAQHLLNRSETERPVNYRSKEQVAVALR